MFYFKRHSAFITAVLVIAAFLVPKAAPAHPSIDIVASNWKFTPQSITLHVGQETELRFTSSEGVHGIQSDDLGIPLTTITPGKFVSVTVKPKKAGKYVLHCAVVCGPGHANMTLNVDVEP